MLFRVRSLRVERFLDGLSFAKILFDDVEGERNFVVSESCRILELGIAEWRKKFGLTNRVVFVDELARNCSVVRNSCAASGARTTAAKPSASPEN